MKSIYLTLILLLLATRANSADFAVFDSYFKRFIAYYRPHMPEYDQERLENSIWYGTKQNIAISERLLAISQAECGLGRNCHTDMLGAHYIVLIRELQALGAYNGPANKSNPQYAKWIDNCKQNPYLGTYLAAAWFTDKLAGKYTLDEATKAWNANLSTVKGKKQGNDYLNHILDIEKPLIPIDSNHNIK